MTSPVHIAIDDSGSTIIFVIPSSYNEQNLPKPNDPSVRIQKAADEYVAVIKFGGYASDKDLVFYSDKFNDILEKGYNHQWEL